MEQLNLHVTNLLTQDLTQFMLSKLTVAWIIIGLLLVIHASQPKVEKRRAN
ncbi:MAG: hypothetical protein AAFO07_07155 [Bacteroidota bacterium]